MMNTDTPQEDTRETFGHRLWQNVVKPVVETAERHQQFDTLIHCHAHIVSLFALMQAQHFRPDVTELCLDQYICILERTIEKLHQEITDADDTL